MSAPATKTILIVDDQEDVCLSLTILLRMLGYRTATAHDGRDALRYLRCNPPPQLIVLDLRMPGMNGLQFCQERRHDPALADIPILIISGEPDAFEYDALQDVTAYCQKGNDPMQMLRIIDQCCQEPVALIA